MTRTESAVIAEFDDPSAAQAAAAELTASAFAGDHIHVVSDTPSIPPNDKPVPYPAIEHDERDIKGWLESVCGQDSETERPHYERAVRNGKVLLGVSTPDQMVDTVAEILTHHSPLEVRRDGGSASSPASAPADGQARLARKIESID